MVKAWEYTRVSASASSPYSSVGEYEKVVLEAAESWLARLNERGAEGWELVSERFAAGSSGPGPWAEYGGTMKRPRPQG